MACAAAIACLDIFSKDHVLENLSVKIKFLETCLSEKLSNLPHVGDIRQCGFMVGIELVENKSLRKPYPHELRMGAAITQNARKYGVILRPLGDVVVIMPPLSIETDQIEAIVSAIQKSIKEIC